jgi:multidrug efflux pump subunit AcrA (membrane-fusion protein)/YHS domain-containing protein
MRLVPVYAGGTGDKATPGSPGMIEVGPARQQSIGVRTDEVRRAPAAHLLRLLGRVTVDDARLYRLNAGTDGWVRVLNRNSAGAFVKKDQLLASYYAQNLLAFAQTYVFALQSNPQAGRGDATLGYQRTPPALNLQVALDTLRSLGMSDYQLEEIQKTREVPTLIHLYSPIAGFVIARNISPGQRFDKGAELYRIADIGRVWVMTDIFEKDRDFLRPGAMATVRYQGRAFPARMSDALPQFDPETRTLKTRFELDNADFFLQPDMFVDVDFQVNMPAALTVPADAVLDSGLAKTVFVVHGAGWFEPRRVQTGWRLGDRVQITAGLEPGERIVVSGNFLIDSESNMRLPAARPTSMAEAAAPEEDPVCGMDVDPKAPDAIKMQHGGKAYYFCSDRCRKSFEANPEKYIPQKGRATP